MKGWPSRTQSSGRGTQRWGAVLALALLLVGGVVLGQTSPAVRAQSGPPASATATPTATATQTAGPSPAATGTAAATAPEDQLAPLTFTEESPGGGASNRIVVINRTDNRLRVRAKVQLNHIPGDNASPVNYADAFSSCNGCQTFAVALQIDLISQSAQQVAPHNQAIALNYECQSCNTVARALQYVIQTDDPNQIPGRVHELVNQMNRQLDGLARDQSVADAGQAESVLNGVIGQFDDLAQSLSDQRDESTDTTTPGASASP